MQQTGFFGGSRRSLVWDGGRASESTYSAGSGLPRHSHERAHLCLVVRGEYREALGGAVEPRGPMTLIYYPPDCPHAEEHRTDGRHFLIEWDAEWVRRSELCGVLPTGATVLDRPTALFAGLRAFRLLCDDKTQAWELEEALVSLMDEMSVVSTSEANRAPAWLSIVMDRLSESSEAPLGLLELSGVARVHPSHLARTFRRFTGCTLGQMRRRFQTRDACRRLAGGSATLCHVAVDAGFSDQSHMTRAIRVATGFTPGSLRDAITTA